MSNLEDFLGKIDNTPEAGKIRPEGVEWFACARCQVCSEDVDEQTLYPAEHILTWTCSRGHRSIIEGYTAF